MPELARFHGIIVKMFFSGRPPAHFHVLYGELYGVFDIETQGMIEGDLPPKTARLVSIWAALYKQQLLEVWNRREPRPLPPLV